MAHEVIIDRALCMGSGNCSFWAPRTFDLDDEGLAVVNDPEGDAVDKLRAASDGCPTGAIRIEEV